MKAYIAASQVILINTSTSPHVSVQRLFIAVCLGVTVMPESSQVVKISECLVVCQESQKVILLD